MKKIHSPLNGLLSLTLMLILFSCSKKKDETVTPAVPIITSILPSSAKGGDTISVLGKNLPLDLATFKININNKSAKVISATSENIQAVVPSLAGSGEVTVSVGSEVYEGPTLVYNYKVIVTTIAGSGLVGNADGEGTNASFNCPWGLAADAGGNVFVADCYNRLIRKIAATDGHVSTYPIPAFVDSPHFYSPYNLAIDPATSNIFVTDFNEHLMRMDPAGNMSVIYAAQMPLTGIAVSPNGQNLYITNNNLGTITKTDIDGKNSHVFTTGLTTPRNIIFDNKGTMFVAAYPSSVYTVSAAGTASPVANDPDFQGWEVAADNDGNFYLADHVKNRIQKIDKNGTVSTIAGSGLAADIDGIGTAASFDGPQGITIDAAGNLYVSTFNYLTNTGNKIRKVTFE